MATGPTPASRALQMNSAQSSDRRSSGGFGGNGDDPMGGDTQLSDSSQTGYNESGQSSPLDIGQFGHGYTANQVPDAGEPVAGGGYQESEAERALMLQRAQRLGQRLQEQMTGAGTVMSGQPGIAQGTATGMQAPEETAPSEEGEAAEQPEGEEKTEGEDMEEELAMQMQQQQQQDTVQAKVQKAKETIDSIKETKQQIDNFRKKLKRIKDVSEGAEVFSAPEDLGLSLIILIAQMNIQMINKRYFKFALIPDQSFIEDAITVCVDCSFCATPFTSPPCCFVTLPLIVFMAAGSVMQNDAAFKVFSQAMGFLSNIGVVK